jgi:hypothetical protein
MRYLLSDLRITDSVVEYIKDCIKVYFNVDSSELPHLHVGIRRYLPTRDSAVLGDLISEDVTKFIEMLHRQDIDVELLGVEVSGSTYTVSIKYQEVKLEVNIE